MKKKSMKKLLKWVRFCLFFKKLWINCNWFLSKQTRLKDPQQINFIGKLLKNTGATMFFIIEKPEETTFNFSQNSATMI